MKTRNKLYRPIRASQRVAKMRESQRSVDKARTTRSISRRKASATKRSRLSKTKDRDNNNLKSGGGTPGFEIQPPASYVPRSTGDNAPRDAVFHTVELIEQILLYLPLRSVFLCQLVNKHLQNLISRSCYLQTVLFLRSANGPRQTWKHENPQSDFPNFGHPTLSYWNVLGPGKKVDETVSRLLYTPAHLCPLLRLRWTVDQVSNELFLTNSAVRYSNGLSGDEVKFNIQIQPSHPAPPWGKMYLSDPPAFSAKVRLRFSLQRKYPRAGSWEVGSIRVRRDVRNSEGLKMEDVMWKLLHESGVQWDYNGRYYETEQKPMAVIERLERQYKVKAVLDLESWWSELQLEGMVIPTEEEWRTVK